jgi:hypothetical protein
MKTTIKNWIKANCQDQPTDTKIEFYNPIKDTTKTVYLRKDYKGYLTDDLDDFGDFEWRAWGSNLSLIDDNLEIIIYDTNITNQVLY